MPLGGCEYQLPCGYVAVAVMKIKDDVVAGKRPATRLFLEDVPDYVKEITSQCWAQEPDDRPMFSGTTITLCLLT